MKSYETKFALLTIAALGLLAVGQLALPAGGWRVAYLITWVAIVLTGLLWRPWWFRRVRKDLPIFLMLHSVADEIVVEDVPNNTVRPAELRTLIRDLKAAGYVFQTVSDACRTPRKRSVVLTFDDGYADNYTNLFPIIREENVCVTCFVTNRGMQDEAFLTADQIRTMSASGLVEFGGHTATHTVLNTVSLDVATREVKENVAWLKEVLGVAPKAFAYPCGGYNDNVTAIVKRAGYLYAVTMDKKMRPVAEDPYRIHRQIIPRDKTPLQNYLIATRGRYRL